MAYIGNDPSNRFVAPKAASVFSGDGSTTAFTLDHAVGSDEDILVSVDGVIQEPSVAYAVSNGTTLTFTGAPSSNSGNNIFVYYLFRTVGTVSHPSNNALTASTGTFTGDLAVDTNVLKVDTTNNRVGFNITSPSNKVHTHQTSSGGNFIQVTNSTTGTTSSDGFIVGIDSGENANLWNYENENMVFATNNTEHMRIDNAGHITKPLQPAFNAVPSAKLENFAINQYNNVDFASERIDRNSDYAAGSSPTAFTAPVTGIYQLNFHLYIQSVDTGATWFQFSILTSNKEYTSIIDPNFDVDLGYYPMSLAVAADMDANDTAYVRMYQLGGAAQMDVATNSSFSGYLVC